MSSKISPEFIALVKKGEIFILCDHKDRENEGDLIVSAEHITEEQMAFIIRHTSGIVFLSMTNEIADRLELPYMVSENTSKRQTPFTVTIEAKHGVSTGVSASDRVTTVKTAVARNSKPEDLCRPGHVFPLRAKDGGVMERAGHTEGSIELMKIAGLLPCAVGAELMNEDGTMMRSEQINHFASKHGLSVVSIQDVKEYLKK